MGKNGTAFWHLYDFGFGVGVFISGRFRKGPVGELRVN
jgi:hypothetical protein